MIKLSKKINVSILLPVYNCEKTLKRSLLSIKNQTYQGFEVIVIINNCTDSSEKIAKTFLDKMNLKIVHCKTQGIAAALNTGIFESSANIMARQDGDDYWHATKLEKQMQFMSQNPEIDILGTQIRLVDINGKLLDETITHPTANNDIKHDLINYRNAIAHPSVVFRKSILLKSGMYEDTYEYMEDYSLWLKCLRWCNFANIDEKLVDYTVKHNIKYNPKLAVLACNNMRNIFQQQQLNM